MAKILVIGAGGQLGHCIKKIAEQSQRNDLLFPDEAQANILDTTLLQQLFAEHQPQYVINCAAYTAVDKAEDEKELAYAVNVSGAENLASLCEKYQSTLIHISTDFVFEGNQPVLQTETDITRPISVYGSTKLESEQKVAQLLPMHYIIRTSWLYSEYGNNFVKTMLKLGSERDTLSIIADQIGSPTYAIDLAKAILHIIDQDNKAYGLYHYSNEGAVSWYDFAQAIFKLGNIKVTTHPIPTSAYPTKASRPHFSVMDKRKIKACFGLDIPYWRDSLEKCIAVLQQ